VAYPDGTPIDTSVTLPQDLGGISVAGATEMSDALASSQTFATCLAEQLTSYAIGYQLDSDAAADCGIQRTYDTFTKSGGGTFADMIQAVATSDAMLVRTPKVGP
jgi:hypothetical protein